MPYSNNDELPKAVRSKLSTHQQSIFRNVFNSMMDQEGMSESRAFAGAWSQAKRSVEKADYQGSNVELDKPFRMPAGSTKKFGVYVKDGDKVKKVTFGDPNMEIRRDDPDARANFRARHSCDAATDKTTPRYWSCRAWESDTTVTELTKNSSEQYHYLYKTTNSANGKYYYGIHSTKNLDDGYLGSGVALKAAIKKHGKDIFEKEILEFFPDRESLLVAEMLLVDEAVVKSSDTYNVSLGGMSYVDSLKCLSEEAFIQHQTVAGKAGGIASYELKTDAEKELWHKAGRAASSGSLGKKLNIKDLESYKEIRKETALNRPRYHCPHCNLQNLDGGNLKQHLAKVHNDGGFEEAKKSCRMWEAGTSVSEMTNKVEIVGEILKRDDEERLAFGWAYVSTVDNQISLDHSDEFIRPDQLAKAATNFMLSLRTAKRMHSGASIGEVVHSMPLTNEIAKALGIQSNREGWLVAIKVYDDQTWQDVKSGKLAAFSIGGRALKEMV